MTTANTAIKLTLKKKAGHLIKSSVIKAIYK